MIEMSDLFFHIFRFFFVKQPVHHVHTKNKKDGPEQIADPYDFPLSLCCRPFGKVVRKRDIEVVQNSGADVFVPYIMQSQKISDRKKESDHAQDHQNNYDYS